VKKGRHRRYEEARALKRGPDLDIEAIFTDLESDRPAPVADPVDDVEAPLGGVDADDPAESAGGPGDDEVDDLESVGDAESLSDDGERERS